MGKYVYNLNAYCISFKELESSVEEERSFILKKNKAPLIRCLCMYYVTDITGFALIFLEAVEFRFYYCEFEQKFCCKIKICIPVILMEKLNFLSGAFGLQHAWRIQIQLYV